MWQDRLVAGVFTAAFCGAAGTAVWAVIATERAQAAGVRTGGNIIVHEVTLSDGTKCAVADKINHGTGISCNWRP